MVLIVGLAWTFKAAYLMVLMASLASGFLTALLSAWQTALCLQASSSTDIRLRAVSTMSKLVQGYKKVLLAGLISLKKIKICHSWSTAHCKKG
jgi:hypothetical protein